MAARHELAEFCDQLSFEALPNDVVEVTKLCILDQIGLIITGATIFSQEVVDLAKFVNVFGGIDGKKESTIIPTGEKDLCANAALVNTAVGTLNCGATHQGSLTQATTNIVPATISVAEKMHASGRDLILAHVIGIEILTRVGMALVPGKVHRRGFHPTAVCAPIGCAAATGKLLGLSGDKLAEALSIAAVHAAGSSIWEGERVPGTYHIQFAIATETGIQAAMLAQIGVTGVDTIFEDQQRGFLRVHSENPDYSKLTENLGSKYETKDQAFKKYFCGTYLHTPIEGFLEMLRGSKIQVEDIREIEVRLPETVIPMVGSKEYPANFCRAQLNARYVVAATPYLGDEMGYSFKPYASETRKDPRITNLFKVITVTPEPELDKIFPQRSGCVLTIDTNDGRRFTERNDGPSKGQIESPLSRSDLEMKFVTLVTPILGKNKTDKILNVLRELDKVDDVSKLTELLVC